MDGGLLNRFSRAVAAIDRDPRSSAGPVEDLDAAPGLRRWLDGADYPLPWTNPAGVTADEWFFVTTLYGEMNLAGQRTHIRGYFAPLFVSVAKRDIRNFVPGLDGYRGLRSRWMRTRLCRMADVLKSLGLTMEDYAEKLRSIERSATPDDPTPSLDRIVQDHRATGWKTLSVFVRDCIRGNSFSIDSRVEKTLKAYDLPVDERTLVGLSLAVGRNPRQLARQFYWAGGEGVD
jgi:hypothetical protein